MPGLGSLGRAVSGGLGKIFGGAGRAAAAAPRGLLSAASTVPGATGHVFSGAEQAAGSAGGGLLDAAGGWLRDTAKGVARDMVGSPGRAVSELRGGTAFAPGGIFHHSNTLWPAAAPEGSSAFRRAMPWVNRALTVGIPGVEAVNALAGGGDPSKGRIENALGAIGGGLGFAYGMPAVGMLGAPYVGRAGRAAGEFAGRMLGSRGSAPQAGAQQDYQFAEPNYMASAYPSYHQRTAAALWKRAAGMPNMLPAAPTSAQNTPVMKPPAQANQAPAATATSPRAPTATTPVVAAPRM